MTDPANLGKYEIRGVLGRGAMGVVYDGWDPVISRRVAIKCVPLTNADNPDTQDELARFKREAQAAGRLHHPNIVGIYDYGETAELAYIVMEFVDGDSLKGSIDKQERFPVTETVRILEQLLTGLQFSHDRGVVHRDIKPANVMITPAGEVKIADFGIARIENSSMTQAGTVMGTPFYMSPEQFMGQTVDARTDLYSTGVLLYQMLTGERPFEGSMTGIMHKALHTEPLPPSTLSVNAPRSMDAVVARAMAKRPDDRYPDAKSFARALRDALDHPNAGAAAAEIADDATVVRTASASSPIEAATMIAQRPMQGTVIRPAPLPPPPAKRASRLPLIAAVILIVLAGAGAGAWYVMTIPAAAPSSAARQAPIVVENSTGSTGSTPSSGGELPKPIVPPPRPIVPPMTAASINAALKPIACTLARASLPDATHVALDGVGGAGTPETALRDAVAEAAPEAILISGVKSFTGPYCGALDVLRAANDGGSGAPLMLSLKDAAALLHKNQNIVLQLTMPDFAGYLLVDYLTSDGSMTHLVSDDGANLRIMTPKGWKIAGPAKIYAANTSFPIGQPDANGASGWAVDAPFGTDMIIATASSAPLFAGPRPIDDTPDAYLRALQAAVATAETRGARIATQALPLETAP